MIFSHLFLILASFAAGIISSVAGGGAFLTFPGLMLTGLDPRAANITSTLALYPMQVSTGFSGRKTASGTPHLSFKELFIISFVGGVLGAILLLLTPATSFARLVPWLVLFSTLVFAWGSFRHTPSPVPPQRTDRLGRISAAIAQFAISIYGGYFGGGIGLLMLATLAYAGMNIRQAITTKNILAAVMNTAAVGVFILSTDVYWFRTGIVAVAAIIGGLVGVQITNKISEHYLRFGTVIIGLMLAAGLFWRAHH